MQKFMKRSKTGYPVLCLLLYVLLFSCGQDGSEESLRASQASQNGFAADSVAFLSKNSTVATLFPGVYEEYENHATTLAIDSNQFVTTNLMLALDPRRPRLSLSFSSPLKENGSASSLSTLGTIALPTGEKRPIELLIYPHNESSVLDITFKTFIRFNEISRSFRADSAITAPIGDCSATHSVTVQGSTNVNVDVNVTLDCMNAQENPPPPATKEVFYFYRFDRIRR